MESESLIKYGLRIPKIYKKKEEEKKKILEERKQAAERKENLARLKKEPAVKKKTGAEAGRMEAEKKEPDVTQLSLFDTLEEPAGQGSAA